MRPTPRIKATGAYSIDALPPSSVANPQAGTPQTAINRSASRRAHARTAETMSRSLSELLRAGVDQWVPDKARARLTRGNCASLVASAISADAAGIAAMARAPKGLFNSPMAGLRKGRNLCDLDVNPSCARLASPTQNRKSPGEVMPEPFLPSYQPEI